MAAIRDVVCVAVLVIGFTKSDIRGYTLKIGEAMALILSLRDPDTIRLVGRWQSNTILCYL